MRYWINNKEYWEKAKGISGIQFWGNNFDRKEESWISNIGRFLLNKNFGL